MVNTHSTTAGSPSNNSWPLPLLHPHREGRNWWGYPYKTAYPLSVSLLLASNKTISAITLLSIQRRNVGEPPYLWALSLRKETYYSMTERDTEQAKLHDIRW